MAILSSLHDPKHERYAIYYSVVLVVVMLFATLMASGFIETMSIEGIMVFFEGFVSMFMLSRNEKVAHAFSSHMSQTKCFFKNGYGSIAKFVERVMSFTTKFPKFVTSLKKG